MHSRKLLSGLTDDQKTRRLSPKRAANILKLFNLERKLDVRKLVVRREARKKNKASRIQRLCDLCLRCGFPGGGSRGVGRSLPQPTSRVYIRQIRITYKNLVLAKHIFANHGI